jgi:hypothetical protein
MMTTQLIYQKLNKAYSLVPAFKSSVPFSHKIPPLVYSFKIVLLIIIHSKELCEKMKFVEVVKS